MLIEPLRAPLFGKPKELLAYAEAAKILCSERIKLIAAFLKSRSVCWITSPVFMSSSTRPSTACAPLRCRNAVSDRLAPVGVADNLVGRQLGAPFQRISGALGKLNCRGHSLKMQEMPEMSYCLF